MSWAPHVYELGDTLDPHESPYEHQLQDGFCWIEIPDSGLFVCSKAQAHLDYVREPWAVLRREGRFEWKLHYVTADEERARRKADLCARAFPRVSFFVAAPSAEYRFGDMQIREFDE